MKSFLIAISLFLIAMPAYADLGKIKSEKSYDDALKLAKVQRKPILMMFGFAT